MSFKGCDNIGLIDKTQYWLMELGGTVIFLFSLGKLIAPEYIPLGREWVFYECIIGLVIGMYMMGYKKIPNEIRKFIKGH